MPTDDLDALLSEADQTNTEGTLKTYYEMSVVNLNYTLDTLDLSREQKTALLDTLAKKYKSV